MGMIRFSVDNIECFTYQVRENEPAAILIQPADDNDISGLEREVAEIKKRAHIPFVFTAFKVKNWNSDLSPWKAPAVFGNEMFGDGAKQTLDFILYRLLPEILDRSETGKCIHGNAENSKTENTKDIGAVEDIRNIPVIAGGYSLAGLFSLWSAYTTDRFSAVAAASPSVWFPGWTKFAEEHKISSEHVYLSLGKKEEKTRNSVMAEVGRCIREQHDILKDDIGEDNCILVWNEGNHFKDPDLRTADAFAWCMDRTVKLRKKKAVT